MNTAQTVLSQGNATQRLQAITSMVPWIVLIVLAGLVLVVVLKGKRP